MRRCAASVGGELAHIDADDLAVLHDHPAPNHDAVDAGGILAEHDVEQGLIQGNIVDAGQIEEDHVRLEAWSQLSDPICKSERPGAADGRCLEGFRGGQPLTRVRPRMREENAASRMASNMFRLSEEIQPSVPIPNGTPRLRIRRVAASPEPSLKLLPGLCATEAWRPRAVAKFRDDRQVACPRQI